MKVYMVGGAVRDKLLGFDVKDTDWVVIGSTPEEMIELGYKPVGKDFPVFLHPKTKEEYALARTERKSAPGYKGFTFNTSPDVTLEEDLSRRDLTINAMAFNEDGELCDPYNGRADLDAGLLRHVSPAFTEDPLRILRVARFSARFGFNIADKTLALMKNITESGELEALVKERIWTETEKALAEKYPAIYFNVLRACGALAVVFPEIENLFGIPQPAEHHPEIDTGVHCMMVLELATTLSSDSQVRFAALTHDLGKATTPKEYLPGHRGHEERGVTIINQLCDRLKIPNKYRELAVISSRHHLQCHRLDEMRSDTILSKLEQMDAFRRPERFMKFLTVCESDARGRGGMQERDYPQAEMFKSFYIAAKNVDTSNINKSELNGKEIAIKIQELRISAIDKLRPAI
jgi:tRNA nucleotidyltransferase (CCA-adding enzyme)